MLPFAHSRCDLPRLRPHCR